jgi:hypothetical protein
MGLYEHWIVPRLLDLAMRNRLLDHYRHQTIETVQGLVLEVGVGSGLNLPLYGPAVIRVVAVDPSPELLRLASDADRGEVTRIPHLGKKTLARRRCASASRL